MLFEMDREMEPDPFREREARLEGLNPEQLDAVTTITGPLLIVAGPGSGKTRVLVHRIAHMIDEGGVRPNHILAVTFTNRAAAEMRDRLRRLIPGAAGSVSMHTFHAWCVRVLRRSGPDIKIDRGFTIYDADDSRVAVERAMELAKVDKREFKPRTIQAEISRAKSMLQTPRDYETTAESMDGERAFLAEKVRMVYPVYQRQLDNAGALDFDDLLMRTVQLLDQARETRARYQAWHRHIMVDEFQDTNLAQYRLMQLIVHPRYNNVCVVGDPDQSIYGWRNADLRNILNFRDDFPGARLVNLGRNYRSTGRILEGAGELIKHNRERIDNPLSTDNPHGNAIECVESDGPEEEAEVVFRWFVDGVQAGDFTWSDCAVAYRTNAQSRALEEYCVKHEVPYRLLGGVRFYDRREIRDALAYLKLLANRADDVSLQRIINLPPRALGATTVQRIADFAGSRGTSMMQTVAAMGEDAPLTALGGPALEVPAGLNNRAVNAVRRFGALVKELDGVYREGTVPRLLDFVMERTGLGEHIRNMDDGDERWENVLELRAETEKHEGVAADGALVEFLEHVALVAEVDNYDPEVGAVSLLTLHQSKGLEFGMMAVSGMEEGLLPSYMNEDLEEERRLCYVGMTRAKERLLLTLAGFRRGRAAEPSRFLEEIPNLQRRDESEQR